MAEGVGGWGVRSPPSLARRHTHTHLQVGDLRPEAVGHARGGVGGLAHLRQLDVGLLLHGRERCLHALPGGGRCEQLLVLRLERAIVGYVGEERGVVGAERVYLAHELCVAAGGQRSRRPLPLQQRKGGLELCAPIDGAPRKERAPQARAHAVLGRCQS